MMSSPGLDAYTVVTAQPPEPPEDPDPQAVAYAAQQALFSQEHQGTWTAPLGPARPGRQRTPVPPEDRGSTGDTAGTEYGAMCILDSNGTHVSPGLHCPHNLPAAGDSDEIVARIRF